MAVPDPGTQDYVATIATGIVGFFLTLGAYLKSRSSKPAPDPENMILTAGSIADMKPVRELVAEVAGLRLQITRIADVGAQMLEIERNRDQEAEIERRVDERMADRLGDIARRIPDRKAI